jgi:hypothetical protein
MVKARNGDFIKFLGTGAARPQSRYAPLPEPGFVWKALIYT